MIKNLLEDDVGVMATLSPDTSCKLVLVVEKVSVLNPCKTCKTPPVGNLALANVPDEIFVAFNDVSDAPEPLGASTSVPITKPNEVLAADAEVAAVPPFATGSVKLVTKDVVVTVP
jgi:hypothetical protein